MGLRPNEISALIKEQIKHYDDIIEQKDVGTVVTVGDGVSVIHGLDNAMLGELLLFPNDVYGMVMNLDEDSVGAVLLVRLKKETKLNVLEELLKSLSGMKC